MSPPSQKNHQAPFVNGSTLRHVLVMAISGSVGLLAIFAVDFLSLLYISWLGDLTLTASVGFATQVSFIALSVNIGLAISVAVLVAHRIGRGDSAGARRLAASALCHVFLIATLVSALLFIWRGEILSLLGAKDDIHRVASRFLAFVIPSNIAMALGMAFQALLRAAGDARRSMVVTLAGAIATAILDPLLIFGLSLGVDGAAIATIVARFTFPLIGGWGAICVRDLVARPQLRSVIADLPAMARVAGPAILTNLAAPVGNSYAMHVFAQFGAPTLAAFAIIDRVTPVAFCGLYGLTGSMGPIIGQNAGAGRYDRVKQALHDCFKVSSIYVLAMWALLWIASPLIADLFHTTGDTREFLLFYCTWGSSLWLFLGLLFVSNAAFNNLSAPFLATAFNWGRATLGTIPFVTYGASAYGAKGGYVGIIIGAVIFGGAALFVSRAIVDKRARQKQSGADP